MGRTVGKPVARFVYPLLGNKGAVWRVFVAALGLDWIADFVAGINLPPEAGKDG